MPSLQSHWAEARQQGFCNSIPRCRETWRGDLLSGNYLENPGIGCSAHMSAASCLAQETDRLPGLSAKCARPLQTGEPEFKEFKHVPVLMRPGHN